MTDENELPDDIPDAVSALLEEVREYLDENATDKRGTKLLGKVELALEQWFEDEDDDDEGDDEDDDLDDEDE